MERVVLLVPVHVVWFGLASHTKQKREGKYFQSQVRTLALLTGQTDRIEYITGHSHRLGHKPGKTMLAEFWI